VPVLKPCHFRLLAGALAACLWLPAGRAAGPATTNAATININTQTSTPLAAGFSGFNVPQLRNGVEYFDPKFVGAVAPLKPGMLRFPAGTASMAYDWGGDYAGHMNPTWMNELITGPPVLVGPNVAQILTSSQQLTQAKGGVWLAQFATFAANFGSPAVICFNSFTDTDPSSAQNMVVAAKTLGVNVEEWELSNEAYSFPLIYPTATDYAADMLSFFSGITASDPAATVGLFSSGPYGGASTHYAVWDNALAAYTPRYWNASSVHYYPINSTLNPKTTLELLNGYLAHATTDYINSYIVPLVGADTPVFLTEVNCCSTPNSNPFLTYLYNGIFLAEFAARMSSLPDVKAIGINSLYTDNYDTHGLIQSVDDFENYLIDQVTANPNYWTNTATNPDTQFQFYMSAPGLAMEVADQAINASTQTWPTTVTGGRTVPILGFDSQPIPAVYAQAYLGANGSHYLLIINKGQYSQGVIIQVNGAPLTGSLKLAYVSNSNPYIANSATAQNNVTVETATVASPFTVGPFSVTVVNW
jgi:hypothetical protein